MTFEDEVVRAATRVALCNRLDALLNEASKARKAIVDFDKPPNDQQRELFENPKPTLRL